MKQRRSRENKRKKIVEKSSQVVLHNSNIPRDIIDEILIRLPVKSLFRFKAVSKLWYATISNPSFHGRRRPATRIFAMVAHRPLLLHSLDEKGSIEKFRVPDWCRLEYEAEDNRAEISNSCNGMLLLRLGKRIFLVNPSTHYIERVLTLDKWYYDAGIGFCYDESIGDYKALIFPRFFEGPSMLVASLKEKEWTELRNRMDFGCMTLGPLVNDRLHCNTIVYFNPTKGVFEKIPCPQPKSGHKDAIVGLGVLEGCLCMARRIGENKYIGDVEVLKMKEYAVAESWTILFVLKDLCVTRYGKIKLLLRTDDGNILIKYEGEIWRYNPADKSYTKFIDNSNINVYCLDAVIFVENIFPAPCP